MKVASELLMKLSGIFLCIYITVGFKCMWCCKFLSFVLEKHIQILEIPPHLLNAFLKVADLQIPIQIGTVSKTVQF